MFEPPIFGARNQINDTPNGPNHITISILISKHSKPKSIEDPTPVLRPQFHRSTINLKKIKPEKQNLYIIYAKRPNHNIPSNDTNTN
jgi:hypothetical protein